MEKEQLQTPEQECEPNLSLKLPSAAQHTHQALAQYFQFIFKESQGDLQMEFLCVMYKTGRIFSYILQCSKLQIYNVCGCTLKLTVLPGFLTWQNT